MSSVDRSSPSWLIIAVPILAILQVLAGSLHDLTGLGVSIPERSAANNTSAVPAVYAFAIWLPIFLWSAAFAVFQALRICRGSALLSRLRGPAALAFGMNVIWQLNAQLSGLAWSSFVLIVALLLPLLVTVERVRSYNGEIDSRELWLAIAPLHVLAGWISVATFASLSTTIDVTGGLRLGTPPVWRDALLILLAGVTGAFFSRRARFPAPYGITVGWGLVGIIAKNTLQEGNAVIATAAAASLLLIMAAATSFSRKSIVKGARSPAGA